MSRQSKSAADFDATTVHNPGTAPPPYSTSSTSATAAPPYPSSCAGLPLKENAAQFIARMRLFDGQRKNPDILSIIIVANLVAANPDTKELTLSNAEVATLRLQSIPFIECLKAGIKEQDPERWYEWDKLDSDFIQVLFQYIVLQQDTEGNSYKAWIPVCHDVRPSFRAYGKDSLFASAIGDTKTWWDSNKLERLRGKKKTQVKDYGDFMALWLSIFGTAKERKKEKRRAKNFADYQKLVEYIDEFSKATENLKRMLDEAQNQRPNASV